MGAYAEEMAPRPPEQAEDEYIGFDAGTLSRRGVDPALAARLLKGAALSSGQQKLNLTVNGQPLGEIFVRVNEQGRVCFDEALVNAARLLPPPPGPDQRCPDIREAWPQASIEVNVAQLSAELLVPHEALRAPEAGADNYTHGGVAGVYNYDFNALSSSNSGRKSTYVSLASQLGVNAGDWIIRSRRIDSKGNGRESHARLDTYATRSFPNQRMLLQVGEISLTTPSVAVAQVRGFQIASESALSAQAAGVPVEGIAYGPARIEVRQNGNLFYATVVPAGPFALRDIQPPQRQLDVEVTVIEADGSRRQFVVPAASFAGTVTAPGFWAGAGQVNSQDREQRETWVVSGGWAGQSVRYRALNANVGGAASSRYQGLGGGIGLASQTSGTSMLLQLSGSNAPRVHARGINTQLSLSQPLFGRLSLSATAAAQSHGYRNLLDTTLRTPRGADLTAIRRQYSLNVALNMGRPGALNIANATTTARNGVRHRRWSMAWSNQWRGITLSANGEWSGLGGRADSIYFSANIPLGTGTARMTVRERDRKQQMSLGYNDRLSDTGSYRVSVDRNIDSNRNAMQAGISVLPHYTQMDLGYSMDNDGSRAITALARGGLALHAHGITPSPYSLSDTFALLRTNRPGVKLTTPSGPVWTDMFGQAVASQLSPFQSSQIGIDGASLPKNVRASVTDASVTPSRGAVKTVDISIEEVRRVLLHVTLPDGELPSRGSVVVDDADETVALVQRQGRVLLGNYREQARYWVAPLDGPRCELAFSLPKPPASEANFETTAALCRPTGATP